MKVVLIGSGRLAWSLGPAMTEAGHSVLAVWSRSRASAEALGRTLHAPWETAVENLPRHADLYVIAVSDSGVKDVASKLYVPENALCVHTAGSLPMSLLAPAAERYGVFYPMQTFSKERRVDFKDVPCFLEASSPEAMTRLRAFAGSLSSKVYELTGAGRSRLHVAAVFACNFANHCYALADELLKTTNLPFDLLVPLIDETAAKVHGLSPLTAQTGPAVRGDEAVMAMHRKALADFPEALRLYKMMSDDIVRMKKDSEQ